MTQDNVPVFTIAYRSILMCLFHPLISFIFVLLEVLYQILRVPLRAVWVFAMADVSFYLALRSAVAEATRSVLLITQRRSLTLAIGLQKVMDVADDG